MFKHHLSLEIQYHQSVNLVLIAKDSGLVVEEVDLVMDQEFPHQLQQEKVVVLVDLMRVVVTGTMDLLVDLMVETVYKVPVVEVEVEHKME